MIKVYLVARVHGACHRCTLSLSGWERNLQVWSSGSMSSRENGAASKTSAWTSSIPALCSLLKTCLSSSGAALWRPSSMPVSLMLRFYRRLFLPRSLTTSSFKPSASPIWQTRTSFWLVDMTNSSVASRQRLSWWTWRWLSGSKSRYLISMSRVPGIAAAV